MANMEGNNRRITEKIGFIGGGNMAKAICEGIVSQGISNYLIELFILSILYTNTYSKIFLKV